MATCALLAADVEGNYHYQLHDTQPDVCSPDGFIYHVFQQTRWEEKVEGWYYADLPDPFARALELFVAGYGVLPSGGGAPVLGYPVG